MNKIPVIARVIARSNLGYCWRLLCRCLATPRNDGMIFVLLSMLLISSCLTSTPQAPPQVVSAYSSSSAQPWLSDLYDCAEKPSVAIRLVDSPSGADIYLKVGEPKYLTSFAYQIDQEEILIVTHRQSPVQNLTVEQVQNLFAGFGDPSVQVWVYASGDEIFEVFDQFVMKGRSVSSSAMVAVNPQQMSDVLNNESTAVGILPLHWKAGDVREVYSVSKVPVLAITQTEPQGVINQLVGCLQK